MPVRRKDELLAIGRKHWKAIKGVVESYSLKTGAINIDRVEIKISSFGIVHVRRKDYPLAIREEVRTKVGLAVPSHLPFVGSVRTHHPDFKRRRSNQILFQQIHVISLLLF